MSSFIILTNQIPEQAQRPYWTCQPGGQLSVRIHDGHPPALRASLARGAGERDWVDNRDKSKFIREAVTLNDIFTDFFNSSFDNVLSALFIFLKDESWLRISSAH